MRLIGEAGLVSGLGNGVALPQDEPARFSESQGTEVLTYRRSVMPAKDPREVYGVNAHFCGYYPHPDRRAKGIMEEFSGAAEPRRASKLLSPQHSLDQRVEKFKRCRLGVRLGVGLGIEGDRYELQHGETRPDLFK